MKDLEVKMLSELVKNSRRSDRELAKAIGTSQPTATRIRTKLEKEGYIKEYTAIPDFTKVGYKIMALILMRLDRKSLTLQDSPDFKKMHFEAIERSPLSAVFLAKQGIGLGYDSVILSFHTSYAAFDKFQHYVKETMRANILDMNTFLINLEDEKSSMPFTFKMLANQILTSAEQEKSDAPFQPKK